MYLISCRHDLQTIRQLARSCGHRYKRIVSTTLVNMKTIVSCNKKINPVAGAGLNSHKTTMNLGSVHFPIH